jgi:hypothetical protein
MSKGGEIGTIECLRRTRILGSNIKLVNASPYLCLRLKDQMATREGGSE